MNALHWPNAHAYLRRAARLFLQLLRSVAAPVRRLSQVSYPLGEFRVRSVFQYTPVLLRSSHPPNATKKVVEQASRLPGRRLALEIDKEAVPGKRYRFRCR